MTNSEASTTAQAAAVAAQGAHVASQKATLKKGATKKKGAPHAKTGAKKTKPVAKSAKRASKPAAREGTAKAMVIAMTSRQGGATLEEIAAETGWQKHTVRGFMSTVPKKAGLTVTSTRREDGTRVYKVK